jgi:signal transduction histidine kinase
VDSALLTRAIHNLLSNSMKFSPGREIGLELQRSGKLYRIRFRDPGGVLPPDPFTRYLREPGLEDPRCGLGMGMQLVRSAAIAHGGTVLMTALPGGGLLTELCLPIRLESTVRSPRRPISYTGERDTLLVELSDVLPPEFYK